ncbi:Ribosomal RNA small subunit methyltransferase D [Candidatus Fokinia solitaria]|uniref:Ribosomal RNA small subunit methyltransferase D n=1 Tax=Candidatus Fokinia solitaria TaxID=1802984 RepID=A0A2U8BSL6_9RICK|nr:RsmD family RNA methyltransferase [Candidatus Fokinia solitaria]AWD33270.1 Ribosomal RNA small subunit methyltransferase D [Candidatus Fokinia solitaria]
MKILSGKCKDFPFTTSVTQNISGYKPTKSIVKEAVFNILHNSGIVLKDSNFLDVCAGTGACSFEALSNGIDAVTMIEMDGRVYSQILKNVERFIKAYAEFGNSIEVIRGDFQNIIPNLRKTYDVLYFDPPYEHSINAIECMLMLLRSFSFMREEGMIFYEIPSSATSAIIEMLANCRAKIRDVKQKKYGDTTLIRMIYRLNALS